MLAEHVERPRPARLAVQITLGSGLQRGDALHHLETVGGHQTRLGGGVVAVIGAADALHEAFDVLRRTHLNDQIHRAPVDAEIKAAGGDHRPQFPRRHRRLHPLARVAGKAAVVNADRQILTIGKPKVVKEQLGLRAGVVKDDGGAVRADRLQYRRDRIAPATARPGRGRQIVQHRNVGGGAWIGGQDLRALGGQKPRQCRRILDRGREADAAQAGREALQPREAEHQLIAALAVGDGVDLIHDHPLQPGKDPRRILIGQKQREAFRCGQQDLRRIGALAAALALAGVAGAVLNADIQAHFRHRPGQIAPDIRRQRFQRRDIERVQPGARGGGQIGQHWQKPGQSLAAAGGGNQQKRRGLGPRQHRVLMRMQLPAARGKPIGKHGRQEGGQGRGTVLHAPNLTRRPPLPRGQGRSPA